MDLPRAFDASLFSLPFRLPLETPSALDADDGGSFLALPAHAKSVMGGGAELGSDMGITGGLGSGSSLGTRADQALLTFKHASAAATGEDGGEARQQATAVRDAPSVPILRPTPEDEDALVNDLLLLHALDNREALSSSAWRSRLLESTIPNLGSGLQSEDVPQPATLAEEAQQWLTCPYTKRMAAVHPWLRAPTLIEPEAPAPVGEADKDSDAAAVDGVSPRALAPTRASSHGDPQAPTFIDADDVGAIDAAGETPAPRQTSRRQAARQAGVALSVMGDAGASSGVPAGDAAGASCSDAAALAGVHPVTGAALAGWGPAPARPVRADSSATAAPSLPTAVERLQAFLEIDALEVEVPCTLPGEPVPAAAALPGQRAVERMPLPGSTPAAAASTAGAAEAAAAGTKHAAKPAAKSVEAGAATLQLGVPGLAEVLGASGPAPAPVVTHDEEDEADDALDAILSDKDGATTRPMWRRRLQRATSTPTPSSGAARSWAVTQRMSPEELAAAEARFDPVLKFGFQLDAFQREAIAHMELEGTRADIFVAAHTSAGKTVVAEYAIAQAIAHRSRAIYTSPIKALSNQKFNDLKRRFGGPDGTGVGLVTGDVRINGDASCLVMTTEILRSMLYRSDPIVRETEWVIFDEMHYINDEERGIVYEEVLLLLPRTVGLIFLSATAPNREQFAEWVGRIKQKPVYVLATAKRPIPLNHWLYVNGHLTLLMDGQKMDAGDASGWRGDKYRALAEYMKKREKPGAARTRVPPMSGAGGTRQQHKEGWGKLLSVLDKEKLLPAIVFTFSRAAVDECANQGISSSAKLTTAKETAAIRLFFDASVRKLAPVDRELPQIIALRELLSRGIGTHHAGMLPIMKEVVEILFARGLLKIMFCTETIAMGVNLPARSVIFNGLRKPEATGSRYLLPAEYTQMAGRAGRRGLDVRGTVIIMVWGTALPPDRDIKAILAGSARNLTSQFRLTWNLMLNLIRTDIPVTQFMAKSFAEFGAQKALLNKAVPAVVQQAQGALAARRRRLMALGGCGQVGCACAGGAEAEAGSGGSGAAVAAAAVASYYKTAAQLQRTHMALMDGLTDSTSVLSSLLAPGRVVVLDAFAAPAAVGDASSGAARRQTFRHLPAVVLGYDTNEPVPGAVRPGGAAGSRPASRLVVSLAVLFPVGYCFENKTQPAAGAGAAGSDPSTGGAGSAKLAVKGKKAGDDDDDDLDDLVGGFGGKGKGKGGSKGGKGGGSSTSSSAAAAAPTLPVKLGHYQACPLVGAPAPRTVGVVQVRWGDLARVTSLSVAQPKGAAAVAPAAVLDGTGSASALEAVAAALWQVLERHGADAASAAPQPPASYGCAALRLPALNPQVDLKPPVQDVALVVRLDATAAAEAQLTAAPRSACPAFTAQLAAYGAYLQLKRRWQEAKKQTGAQALTLFEEMRARFSLLRQLGYTRPGAALTGSRRRRGEADGWDSEEDEDAAEVEMLAAGGMAGEAAPAFVSDIVGLKGRVAAEVNTCDELLFTEMIFQNILGPLTPAECAALLSALVTQESRLRRVRLAVEEEEDDGGDEAGDEAVGAEQSEGTPAPAPDASQAVAAAGGVAAAVVPAAGAPVEEAAAADDADDAYFDTDFTGPGLEDEADAAQLRVDAAEGAALDADGGAEAEAVVLEAGGEAALGQEGSGQEAVASDSSHADSDADAPAARDYVLPTQPLHEIVEAAARRRPIRAVPQSLAHACEQLRRLALELGRVQREAGLIDSEEEHADKLLNFGLVVPTYAWACGQTFAQVCGITDCMEGAVVRTMSRLEETCREVRNAARIMGDPALLAKMEAASTCIKRDIVFAASLYFQ